MNYERARLQQLFLKDEVTKAFCYGNIIHG